MPELPEVETTRRFLAPVVEGRLVAEVEVSAERTARRNTGPAEVVARLTGRRVAALGRRGKFLLAALDDGATWVTHLGMSGRIRTARPVDPRDRHTRFVATFDGLQVRLVDPRTFGFVAVLDPTELATALAGIGPDALEDLPTTEALAGRLAGRTAPIKALLLDQRLVSGLGNIYADEVLHRAGIHPRRPAGALGTGELAGIRSAITEVLTAGIAAGGTSLDDLAYLLPDGRAGAFTERLAVYGRTGLACRRCGSPVERVVVAGRSSHFCPRCQPERSALTRRVS